MRVVELLNALAAPVYLERVALGDGKHNMRVRKAIRRAIRNQMEGKGILSGRDPLRLSNRLEAGADGRGPLRSGYDDQDLSARHAARARQNDGNDVRADRPA